MTKNKIKVNHHSSMVIVESESSNQRFLFNQYDENYPRPFFRLALNLIGGNMKVGLDKSPYDIAEREISEEFSGQFEELEMESGLVEFLGERTVPQRKPVFALMEDIDKVRIGILAHLTPYKDFLTSVPTLDGKPPFNYTSSVYVSRISENFFKIIGDDISKGMNLINEGYLYIADRKEVASGKLRFAWGTRATIGEYLSLPIPNQMGISTKPIGKPRKSFEDYLVDFSYKMLESKK